MKVKYRGMHDIIKAIAKENGYSMNKARKEFANMWRTGFLPYEIEIVRGNKNRSYYYPPDLTAWPEVGQGYRWIGNLVHPEERS